MHNTHPFIEKLLLLILAIKKGTPHKTVGMGDLSICLSNVLSSYRIIRISIEFISSEYSFCWGNFATASTAKRKNVCHHHLLVFVMVAPFFASHRIAKFCVSKMYWTQQDSIENKCNRKICYNSIGLLLDGTSFCKCIL